MFNYADKINQKRGIALIKVNGINNFNDKDYFGYNDFSATKIKRDNLGSISDLSKDNVNSILSDKDWKNEKYFILIKTQTSNEEINEVYNYKKLSLYAYDKEEIVFSLVSDRGKRTMSGIDDHVIRKCHQFLFDRCDQLSSVSAREIASSY